MTTGRATGTVAGILGLLLALFWAILRSGFTMTVVMDDVVASAQAWPHRYGGWMTQFYADSPLNILTFRALRLSTNIDAVRLGFVTSLIAIALLAAWMVVVTDPDGRWRAGRLLVLSPLPAVLFISLGSYDPFTIAAWGVVLFAWMSRHAWVLAVAGILLGFQHFEQAGMGAVALLLTWLALREDVDGRLQRVNPAWILPGLVLGKFLLVAILLASGESAGARTEWIQQSIVEWTKVGIVTGPFLLWSLFAGLWVVVVYVFLRSSSKGSRLLLVGAFAIGLLATLVSGDRPRVFVIVMLPSLALAIVAFIRRTRDNPHERQIAETIAWLAPPILLAGKTIVNANIIDNAYVTFMWISGLG